MSNINFESNDDDTSVPAVPAADVLKRTEEESSLDTVFAALRDQRRRFIIYYLHQRGPLEVDELVALIAASENGGDHDAVPADDRRRVKIRLVHVHLPKLVDLDIVEYDEAGTRVRLREGTPPHLESYLNEAAKVELR